MREQMEHWKRTFDWHATECLGLQACCDIGQVAAEAVAALAHAEQVNEKVQAFLDYEVRAWLGEYTHHTQCGIDSGCSHGNHERGMYEMLDSYVDLVARSRPGRGRINKNDGE